MNRSFCCSIDAPSGVLFGWHGARFFVLVAGVLMVLATPVWAQRYRQINPKLDEREAKTMQRKVGQAVKDEAGLGANASVVNDYFAKYYFPMMTQADPDNLAKLGDRREKLFTQYIRVTANPDSLATLTTLAVKVGSAISKGNYHPAVRYNGALILGNLDQQIAGGTRQNPTPPIPLPAATAVMLELLEQEDFQGVKVHPSVRLGALIGLERHARFGIAPEHVQRVTKAALDVIAQENPAEEVSQDVHHWMKCRAASVLANLHREKPAAEVQVALNGLMADESLDLENRCFVAGLMQRLVYAQAEGVEPGAIVAVLGSLSQDVMQAEAELARDYQKEILGGGGFNRGGFRGRGRAGSDDEPKLERRQLLARLQAIYKGGGSLGEGVTDDAKSRLQSLLDAMKPARLAARDKDSTEVDVANVVIQAAKDVDQIIQSWNQGAAEEPEADFS